MSAASDLIIVLGLYARGTQFMRGPGTERGATRSADARD